MGKMDGLSREELEKMADLFLNMCLHFCGAQYTESMLRARGFGDRELAAIGFDVNDEWAEMDACMEV
jgi:hypothetical protein